VNHHEDIEKILKNRRFETTAAHCIKKIVEFTKTNIDRIDK